MDSKNKLLWKEMNDNCISIQKFLVLYCGINCESFGEKKIGHEDIKMLLPHLKRTSCTKILENKNKIYIGDIIAVKDSFGQIIPYEKPLIEEINMEFNSELCSEDKKIENIILDENLNKHQLASLCKCFKHLGKMKEYRIANRLLKGMKLPSTKKYKTKKKELIMKGRRENDKY